MGYEVQTADRRSIKAGEPTTQFKVVYRYGPKPWHCETIRYFKDKAKAQAYAEKATERERRWT